MPSFSAISAAAILAFSGMASAIPQFQNMTSSAGAANMTMPANNATNSGIDGKFCPGLDLSIYIDRSGLSYRIECDTNHFGTIIDISVNVTKRAVPSSLDDCINLCDATSSCVGTAFNTDVRTCTLFSDVQAAFTSTGVQFAQRVANAGSGTTISAGGSATSTIYSTNIVTISSCAPTVTNCPLTAGQNAVITQIFPVSSTVYICPAQTTLAATPIACQSCPYTASTATVYSATGGSVVPVATQVVNVPVASGSTMTVTVCTSCAKATANSNNGGNSPAGGAKSTPTASGMVMYTGAASAQKAAGGFAAMVAAAALVL
jgi:hypothetical protein